MDAAPPLVPRSVVLVHGMWGVPDDWRWVQRILTSRGLHVATPDLPSHRDPAAGLLDDVAEVNSAIRACTGPVVVAGWSYGCDVVGVAAEGQGNVARLVYVSSVPQPVQPGTRDGTAFDGAPGMVWDAHGRFVPASGWWNDEGMEFTAEGRAHLAAHSRRPVTRRTLTDPIPSSAWTHLPTTVLIGERDAFNGPEPWTRARERVQDVRVVDCDHFLPFTLPSLVADVILEPLPPLKPTGPCRPAPDPCDKL
ncbi:alpha/beta fold hydrolase [Sinomonas soli]